MRRPSRPSSSRVAMLGPSSLGVSTRSKFTIPSQAFPGLQQLKVVRGNLKELVMEDEVATNGTALEIGNCRSLEKIAIGKGCFPNATTLTISKVASLYSLTVGAQSFEETDTWNIAGGIPRV